MTALILVLLAALCHPQKADRPLSQAASQSEAQTCFSLANAADSTVSFSCNLEAHPACSCTASSLDGGPPNPPGSLACIGPRSCLLHGSEPPGWDPSAVCLRLPSSCSACSVGSSTGEWDRLGCGTGRVQWMEAPPPSLPWSGAGFCLKQPEAMEAES